MWKFRSSSIQMAEIHKLDYATTWRSDSVVVNDYMYTNCHFWNTTSAISGLILVIFYLFAYKSYKIPEKEKFNLYICKT